MGTLTKKVDIFRGQILEKSKFHMYVYDSPTWDTTNKLNMDTSYKVFILCMCADIYDKTILYWSCDPIDFTKNITGTSRNYGPANMIYEFDSVASRFSLYYEDINNELVPFYNNIQANFFSISPNKKNIPINIINYGYPYGYTVLNNTATTSWVFRKDHVTGFSPTDDIFREGSNFSAVTQTALKKLKTSYLKINITSKDERNLDYTLTSSVSTSTALPLSGTIYIFNNDGEYNAYPYKYPGSGITLRIDEDTIFETSTTATFSAGADAYIYIRNDQQNFVTIDSSTTNIPFNFMPITEHSYFAGGITKRISSYTINYTGADAAALSYYYAPKSSVANNIYSTGYLSLSTILVFINSICSFFDSCTEPYSNITGELSYSTPADDTTTISIFSSPLDSKQRIFYRYCGDNEYCGKCMGITTNSNFCTATSKTLEFFTDNKDHLSSTVSNNIPLKSNLGLWPKIIRPIIGTQTNPNESGKTERIYIPQAIIIPLTVFVSLGLAISAYFFNRDMKKHVINLIQEAQRQKLENKYTRGFVVAGLGILNIIFMIVVAIYLANPGSNFDFPTLNTDSRDKEKHPSVYYKDYHWMLIALSAILGFSLILTSVFVFYKDKGNQDTGIIVISVLLFIFGISYITLGALIDKESKGLTVVEQTPTTSIASYVSGAVCIIVAITYFVYIIIENNKRIKRKPLEDNEKRSIEMEDVSARRNIPRGNIQETSFTNRGNTPRGNIQETSFANRAPVQNTR